MKPIHLAYRVAQALRRVYWHIVRPFIHGVKVVGLRDGDHVLLVRHSYQSSHLFMLPGGGLDRGENVTEGAARELREETGCVLRDNRVHGEFMSTAEGARNRITVVVGTVEGEPRVDGREIIEARFLPLYNLPDNIAPATLRRLIEVRDGLPPSDAW